MGNKNPNTSGLTPRRKGDPKLGNGGGRTKKEPLVELSLYESIKLGTNPNKLSPDYIRGDKHGDCTDILTGIMGLKLNRQFGEYGRVTKYGGQDVWTGMYTTPLKRCVFFKNLCDLIERIKDGAIDI